MADEPERVQAVASPVDGPSSVARVLREPLLLFLLGGALLFAIDSWWPGNEANTESAAPGDWSGADQSRSSLREIRITDDVLAMLRSEAAFYDGSAPSEEKLEALIAQWVDEEMIFRHAVSQELHLSDGRTRAHLIETMSALWAGVVDVPDDDAVLAHYMGNLSDYYSEPAISFTHVYLRDLPADATAVLDLLRAGKPVDGDDFWAGDELNDYVESALLAMFGGGFYNALASAPVGEWQGPIRSARGYHFVLVHDVREPAPRRFDEVYATVRADVMNAQRAQRIREQLDRISGRFAVVRKTSDVTGG